MVVWNLCHHSTGLQFAARDGHTQHTARDRCTNGSANQHTQPHAFRISHTFRNADSNTVANTHATRRDRLDKLYPEC